MTEKDINIEGEETLDEALPKRQMPKKTHQKRL